MGGFWLARRNQLERMSIVLPVLAAVTTVAFLAIGRANTQNVPASLAFVQLTQFIPEHDTAHTSGLAAIYQQETTDLRLSAGADGFVMPRSEPGDGNTRRLVWTDENQGRWRNVSVPGGSVQFANFSQQIQLAERVTASGQFTSRGFEGRVSLVAGRDPSDALIASLPSPSAAVSFQDDGSFVCRPADVLAQDQFLSTAIVTDESRRRQEIYRELLKVQATEGFASEPLLLTWMEPKTITLEVPDDLQARGSSLAAIPLWIERTPAQTEFLVPATFMPIQSVTGMSGRSLAYNERRGVWIENASRAPPARGSGSRCRNKCFRAS